MGAFIGSCAHVYAAPLGTAGPNDLVTNWVGFSEVGALKDDDDVVRSGLSGDVTVFRDYCNRIIGAIERGEEPTFKFMAIESNGLVQELLYPNQTVTTTGGVTKQVVGPIKSTPEYAFGFEFQNALFDATERFIIPCGIISERADIATPNSEERAYELTVQVMTSDDTNFIRLSNDPDDAAWPTPITS